MATADQRIATLRLKTHPGGGLFTKTYGSGEFIAKQLLPERFSGSRPLFTAIYYLLKHDDFSGFHRIKRDWVWHFDDGSSLTIHLMEKHGNYIPIKVGTGLLKGELPPVSIKAGCLFGATLNYPETFALAGCTVSPSFDYGDFELPESNETM